MDHNPVVQIVDEIALHAVQDFDFPLRGFPRVREGLRDAVIRNGNGGMSPADGRLYGRFRIRQGVHVGHFRVQMQFHALFRGDVLPFRMFDYLHMGGIQLHVFPVPGGFHLPLYAQPHSRFDGALKLPRLFFGEVFLHGHGIGIVRHVNAHAPHTRTAGFPAREIEHFPRYRGNAHFQIQVLHGNDFCPDRVSHQDRSGFAARLCGGRDTRGAVCPGGRDTRGAVWPGGISPARRLHVRPDKAVSAPQTVQQRLMVFPGETFPHTQTQGDGPRAQINVSLCNLRFGQSQPQRGREHQPGKHLKKWNTACHICPRYRVSGFRLFPQPRYPLPRSSQSPIITAGSGMSRGVGPFLLRGRLSELPRRFSAAGERIHPFKLAELLIRHGWAVLVKNDRKFFCCLDHCDLLRRRFSPGDAPSCNNHNIFSSLFLSLIWRR